MSDASQEKLVESEVARDLRVERGDEDRALAAQHRAAVDGGQDLDAVAGPLDHRGPDEDGVDGIGGVGDAGDGQVGLEAFELAAETIAADGDVDGPERPVIGPA